MDTEIEVVVVVPWARYKSSFCIYSNNPLSVGTDLDTILGLYGNAIEAIHPEHEKNQKEKQKETVKNSVRRSQILELYKQLITLLVSTGSKFSKIMKIYKVH